MKRLLFAFFAILVSTSLSAQSDLLQAENSRFDAMVRQDIRQLNEMLSDDLIYTHSSGVVDGKEKILESIKAGTYQEVKVLEQNPLSWETTGVISGKAQMVIADANGKRTIVLKYLDVYRKEGGKWKLIAWQSLRVDNN